jgi:2-polyprenyl-6-hydroxyphenyl methylase/3-demethylubiquinone-9 3-methyltransferase
MWQALEAVVDCVAAGGRLFIAIFNDQGTLSGCWARVKRFYNGSQPGCATVIVAHVPHLVGLRWLVRVVDKRGGPEQGMDLWYDMHDWLGGYPFEVARPEQVPG